MINRADLCLAPPPPDPEHRLEEVTAFWEALRVGSSDAGETTSDGLEDLYQDVVSSLSRNPPDIIRAESITAYAALLLSGYRIL